MQSLGDVNALQAYRIDVDFHLLDAFVDGETGGTGKTFDHELARAHRRRIPLILSGGLTAENVGHAIERVAPFAVDVSSGVEEQPGVKDAEKIKAFAAAVAAARFEDGEDAEVNVESQTSHEADAQPEEPAAQAEPVVEEPAADAAEHEGLRLRPSPRSRPRAAKPADADADAADEEREAALDDADPLEELEAEATTAGP